MSTVTLKNFEMNMRAGRYAAALDIAKQALAGAPGNNKARWHKNAAGAALMLKRYEQAYVDYCSANASMPLSADDFYNFGLCCNELGRYQEAIDLYRKSLQINGRSARTFNNIGRTMNRIGLLSEAEMHLRKALELEPGRPTTELNLATNLLLTGQWKSGWKYYESRLRVFNVVPEMSYARWDGTPRRDRFLLLRTEQGLGDAIQFSRFAASLGKVGLPIIIQSQPNLISLLRTLPNVLNVIGANQTIESKAPIDWAPLMSVPGIMGLSPETVPANTPYLFAAPDRVAYWRRCRPAEAFCIGIAWQGNPQNTVDRERSFPLQMFEKIAAIPGVRLISLQKNFGLEQIEGASFKKELVVLGADYEKGDQAFLDTAALMMSLDVVISCDTSIAHLAGALGRPTFLALPKLPDWRWLLDREDTPWYPTMRLFRQNTAGDWPEVFVRIRCGVEEMMGRIGRR